MLKKKKTYKQIINNAFNFIYAGVCHVFITTSYNKYIVVCSGFTFDGFNFFFSQNRSCRFSFDTLYKAIDRFNNIVNVLINNLDWYKPDYFLSDDFIKMANENVY